MKKRMLVCFCLVALLILAGCEPILQPASVIPATITEKPSFANKIIWKRILFVDKIV